MPCHYDKKKRKWRVRIKANGVFVYDKFFNTKAEALRHMKAQSHDRWDEDEALRLLAKLRRRS